MIRSGESLQLSRQVQSFDRHCLATHATILGSGMSSPLNTAIARLSSGEVSVREAAAAEIYAAGRAPADRVVEAWWSNEELSGLLSGPKPEVTVGLAVQ